MNSGNSCYHSVKNFLFVRLLSKNVKIELKITMILPVAANSCVMWPRNWGRNIGWGCSRIGCWIEYLGIRGVSWQRIGVDNIAGNFMICTLQNIGLLFGWSSHEEWDGRGMWHVWGTGELLIGILSGEQMQRYHFEDVGIGSRIILKLIFKKWDGEDWIDLA
jgi:hypothetical protein